MKGRTTDPKKSAEKHKGIDHVRSFEDAAQFPSFGAVLNPGWVDISFDDPEMSDAFLDIADAMEWKCLVLENPDNHHIHTYWHDGEHRVTKFDKDLVLACGLVADIHGGETYIPLRCNGVERFPPIYDKLDDEDYPDTLPDELIPVHTNIKLWNLEEGAGRNPDLYKYILVLQSQLQLTDNRIRDMYRNVINPYILKTALQDSELDIILRDESFQKEVLPAFYDGNVFKFDVFADYLVKSRHVVKIHNQLHIYEDGIYRNAQHDIEKQMIQLAPKLRKTQRKEVLEYLDLIAEEKAPSDPRYIAFTNGVYDIAEDVLVPYSPDFVITNRIPWDWKPGAYDELVDRTLNKLSCNDPQVRAVLEECAGACMYRSALLAGGKAFILTGDRANGKSTFLDMVKAMVGDDNVASLDLKEIGDRFSTSMIAGKLLNAGDDIADDFLQGSAVSIFKKVVTGNRIKAENKGMDPFEFNPFCKLIFSANDVPRMKDRTGAVMRRLVIIPFNATFSKSDPDYDPMIVYKLTTQQAMEYLIQLAVAGLKHVVADREFTKCMKVQEEMDEYELENNPIVGFLSDEGADRILHQPTVDVFRRYQVYCQQAALQAVGRPTLTKQICKRLGYTVVQKRIDGKITRIFERG